jgi:hypothetical protein
MKFRRSILNVNPDGIFYIYWHYFHHYITHSEVANGGNGM